MGTNASTEYFEIAGEYYVRCGVLGKGSFGKVYAMQHLYTGTIRVVKEIYKPRVTSKGPKIAKQLIKERIILSRLKDCPYIVRCYAALQDESYLYILMEFCSGGELKFHLDNIKKFSEIQAKSYLAQLTVALDKMHYKYRVVHRDLKPENILLDQKGYCAIVDFNMAKIWTLSYIAPELLQGKPHSNKVDYWSLGVIIYEMTHGRLPFVPSVEKTDESPRKRQLLYIRKKDVESIISKRFSAPFRSLLKGLLTIDPEMRFSSKEIKNHEFFADVNWDKVEKKEIDLPFVPRNDRINFSSEANIEDVILQKQNKAFDLSEEQEAAFNDWEWERTIQELPSYDPHLISKYKKKIQRIKAKDNFRIRSKSQEPETKSKREKEMTDSTTEDTSSKNYSRAESTVSPRTPRSPRSPPIIHRPSNNFEALNIDDVRKIRSTLQVPMR